VPYVMRSDGSKSEGRVIRADGNLDLALGDVTFMAGW
jgi:hypothetical protein